MLAPTIDAWNAAINLWFTSLGAPVESLARLFIAALLGGMVGMERELRGRQAGFRTYLLVCLGSALVMQVSSHVAVHEWPRPYSTDAYTIRVDPGRIAYGVMTGIGFLGAGVIVRTSSGGVRGLTTAAGLWCVAAVGLATGFGMYLVACLATLLILLALWILDYIEEILPKVRYRTVTVRTRYEIGCVPKMITFFNQQGGIDVVDATFERSTTLEMADIHVRIAFFNSEKYYDLERKIEGDPLYHLLSAREL